MFKRLADRVTSAVASVTNPSGSPSPVQQLTSMGFSEADARHALNVCNNNVEQATNWLLTNNTGAQATSPAMQATAQMMEDDDLQKALAASLEDSNPTTTTNNNNNNTNYRSAAAKRAGQAALARFEQKNTNTTKPKANTTKKPPTTTKPMYTATNNNNVKPVPIAASHPNVKVPKQLSHHDKEEQILRCANRMAPHPKAVDLVMKSLKQLQQNPKHPKFQSIDTNSAAFQKNLNVPGTIDFFKAMNYHSSPGNLKLLVLSFCDPATIYLGISALEQVQQSQVYKTNKAQVEFDAQLQQLLNTTASSEELSKRAEHLRKCPSEPTQGGSFMQVQLGSTKISRKFDADDTLMDVLNWIVGSTSTTILEKLQTQEWYLVNQNQNGAYNMKTGPKKTLQALGCWPSGRLVIVGTLPEHAVKNTSSRGLGAAGIASDYL